MLRLSYALSNILYSPSCHGQGRTKRPLGFQVKTPSAHLLTTRSGHFTQMRIPIFIVWFDSNWNRTQVSRFSSRLFIHSTTHWLYHNPKVSALLHWQILVVSSVFHFHCRIRLNRNLQHIVCVFDVKIATRGGAEDTRLEAKAKDQGHRRKCSPKKKIFKNFFQAFSKKKFFKKFFQAISKKKDFKNFFQAINFKNFLQKYKILTI